MSGKLLHPGDPHQHSTPPWDQWQPGALWQCECGTVLRARNTWHGARTWTPDPTSTRIAQFTGEWCRCRHRTWAHEAGRCCRGACPCPGFRRVGPVLRWWRAVTGAR